MRCQSASSREKAKTGSAGPRFKRKLIKPANGIFSAPSGITITDTPRLRLSNKIKVLMNLNLEHGCETPKVPPETRRIRSVLLVVMINGAYASVKGLICSEHFCIILFKKMIMPKTKTSKFHGRCNVTCTPHLLSYISSGGWLYFSD